MLAIMMASQAIPLLIMHSATNTDYIPVIFAYLLCSLIEGRFDWFCSLNQGGSVFNVSFKVFLELRVFMMSLMVEFRGQIHRLQSSFINIWLLSLFTASKSLLFPLKELSIRSLKWSLITEVRGVKFIILVSFYNFLKTFLGLWKIRSLVWVFRQK